MAGSRLPLRDTFLPVWQEGQRNGAYLPVAPSQDLNKARLGETEVQTNLKPERYAVRISGSFSPRLMLAGVLSKFTQDLAPAISDRIEPRQDIRPFGVLPIRLAETRRTGNSNSPRIDQSADITDARSSLMPGPIVELTDMRFTNEPFAPEGLARTTASMKALTFSAS